MRLLSCWVCVKILIPLVSVFYLSPSDLGAAEQVRRGQEAGGLPEEGRALRGGREGAERAALRPGRQRLREGQAHIGVDGVCVYRRRDSLGNSIGYVQRSLCGWLNCLGVHYLPEADLGCVSVACDVLELTDLFLCCVCLWWLVGAGQVAVRPGGPVDVLRDQRAQGQGAAAEGQGLHRTR